MSQTPLIAIGLDAADYRQIEKWMAQGHLPVLSGLRDRGVYGRLKGPECFAVETTWTNFHTGVYPQRTGYWGTVDYDPKTSDIKENFASCYDFKEYPPFFSLGNKKVAVFDAPHFKVTPSGRGIQVAAWGAHSPLSEPKSVPENLLAEIEQKFGKHPALMRDHLDWWNIDKVAEHTQKLSTGIERRAQICEYLLKKESWDLFLTVFSESHAIGHDFYFMSREDHPLAAYRDQIGYKEDPCLKVFKKIDEAVGKIIDASPKNAHIVVFSPHGMFANQKDLPSQLFLPEFISRHHFGKGFFQDEGISTKPAPIILKPVKRSWLAELWRLKKESNTARSLLKKITPIKYLQMMDGFFRTTPGNTFYVPTHLYGYIGTHPGLWYKHLWKNMRFFAFPSYGDGSIRINLKGREDHGIVEPKDYDRVCIEAEEMLRGLRSARTGEPAVKKVIRMRDKEAGASSKFPIADLSVLWSAEAMDAMEHPGLGRVGPVPFNRSGAHIALGFYMAAGPGIEKGPTKPIEDSIHLTSSLLHHMGCAIPDHMDAKKVLF